MCGICGIIEFNGTSYHVPSIKRMVKSMHNRGPDDEGYLLCNASCVPLYKSKENHEIKNSELAFIPKDDIDKASDTRSSISYGFKRLSIIDLSYNAHQPMCDESKKYWIVFNGEVYNYKEIRKELIVLGHKFFSDSDTEVVLKSYIQWEEKALQKFNGMFAFSILNTVKDEVFIARDRMGIKPLYYFQNKERFVFGSTIKSIIDSKLYSPIVNWEGLWQNYTFSIAQRPMTCFKDIYALEPAHYLKINRRSKQITKVRYWDIPIGTQDFSLTEKQHTNLLEETLYTSIKYRLNADVDVGTFMSGGIDSSLISAMASKMKPDIKAFTMGFNKQFTDYNEVEEAQETAKLNSMNQIIHIATSDDFIYDIKNIISNYEEPYHHLPANYVISKVARSNNVKVILNGLGGDELFAGYHFYSKTKWWHLLKLFNPIIRNLPDKIFNRLDVAKKFASYKTISEFYTHFNTTFNDADNLNLFKDSKFNSSDLIGDLYSSKKNFTDDIEALSFYNLKSYISNHQTRTIDQFTMNFSIEGRFPFLDHHLIELAFRIPSKYKIKNGTHKYILRNIAKNYIADSALKMKKKGFSLPLEYWYARELKDFISDILYALKKRSIFNNGEIDRIVKSNNPSKIWQLVTTEIWMQTYFDKK